MTRFCRQRDSHSCGPIALLNIDKFFGHRVTYKHLPKYSRRVGCHRPKGRDLGGTYTRAISKILGKASRRTWKGAKQFLRKGDGCIMVQTTYIGHLYLIIMSDDGNIGVVNYYDQKYAAIQITPQMGAAMLRGAYRTWYVNKPTRKERRL